MTLLAELRGRGEGSILNSATFKQSPKKQKTAFTLAEVLITLGIIGVVAALTLPMLIQNYQKKVLQVQFKKFYSTFYNATKYVQATNGAPVSCYYWDSNPYDSAGNPAKCVAKNDYGTCVRLTLSDGSSLPKDYDGNMSECLKFTQDLMKALNTVKFCENHALANGCLTNKHRGLDKVRKELHPDKEFDSNGTFSDTRMKNQYPAFVTADGTIYVRYGAMGSNPLFLVDINGTKGPNKYGYDIFIFLLLGNQTDGITDINGQDYMTEKGGSNFNGMLRK